MKEGFSQQTLHLCLQNDQKFETAALIASTSHSSVYELVCSRGETRQQMAVKLYSENNSPPAVLTHLLNRQNRHLVNILRILNSPAVCVCMQLCARDLKGHLHLSPFKTLPEKETIRISQEIVEGLLQLKGMRLMHGDVKPQNILVDSLGVVKLGDLDFILRQEQFSKKRMRLGTLQYMAPEIMSSWHCSYASDVWSLGVVMFELHFGRHPFPQLQELNPSQESAITSAFAIIKDHLEKTREYIKASLRESSSFAVKAMLQAILSCLVWQAGSRGKLQEVGSILSSGVEMAPVRKGSWSTDCTGLPGQDDIFMFPNSGLLLAFEKLRTILSCLPEEAQKMKEIVERSARLEKERKEEEIGREVEALKSVIGVKYKRMERNFKRLANLEGGIEYSKKGELFVHLKYLLELLDEASVKNTQSQWIKDNCTRSAEHLQ